MKEKTQIPYYLGIDAGSSSVGWAVTDTMYHVLKTKGKAMWGVRLFPRCINCCRAPYSSCCKASLAAKKTTS